MTSSGRSLSATIAELTIRGLAEFDEPLSIEVAPPIRLSRYELRSPGYRGGCRCRAGRRVTTFLLDANVLIALTALEHVHHERVFRPTTFNGAVTGSVQVAMRHR